MGQLGQWRGSGRGRGAGIRSVKKSRLGPTGATVGHSLWMAGSAVFQFRWGRLGPVAATHATRRIDAQSAHGRPLIYIEMRQVVGCDGCFESLALMDGVGTQSENRAGRAAQNNFPKYSTHSTPRRRPMIRMGFPGCGLGAGSSGGCDFTSRLSVSQRNMVLTQANKTTAATPKVGAGDSEEPNASNGESRSIPPCVPTVNYPTKRLWILLDKKPTQLKHSKQSLFSCQF